MPLQHHIHVKVNRDRVIRRRDFLQASAVALAGSTLGFNTLLSAQAAELRKQGKSCILLWMQGGPSQLESFDPKPDHENSGEAKAIDTNVAGIQLSEYWPRLAKVMDHVAIIRSMTSKEGNHQRATYQLHTGYAPTPTVKHPAMGAIAARELPNPDCDLPGFVRIGGFRNSSGGGLLGVEYDPFILASADAPPTNTRVTTSTPRFQRRLRLLGSLEAGYASAGAKREVDDHQKLYDKTAKMVMSTQMKAFDLSEEKAAMREAYGRTRFGNGCLLARRLIETGVPFVEVSLGNWDTHQDNFERTKGLAEQVDGPFAQLLRDLEDRGRLQDTLVVWMGEFGRTPRINARGGRDHYPRAFSVAAAGGGVRGGQVIGATDAAGVSVKDHPVTVNDLFQSICHSLSINAAKENMSSIGRPIKIVDGGEIVKELF